jgi:hypothetical protein
VGVGMSEGEGEKGGGGERERGREASWLVRNAGEGGKGKGHMGAFAGISLACVGEVEASLQ